MPINPYAAFLSKYGMPDRRLRYREKKDPIREAPGEGEEDTQEGVSEDETLSAFAPLIKSSKSSVYTTPDAWEPRNRPNAIKEIGLAVDVPVKDSKAEVPEIFSGKRMNPKKMRRSAMSICVSEEEAQLLRRYASTKEMGFSEWARGVLFKAMGRKPPARPVRE